jgi:chemotaxis family two-component system sensor kinase Cph1
VVRADRERATEVVYNLVSNAAKYMRPGVPGWIEIGWREEATTAGRREPMAFFVRDNGIGIAPEHHDSVFQLFRRLHARDSFGGGSGAGLTISRRIVERHGGRMWIESAQGAGSTFWFTLEPADGSEARGR